MAPVFTLYPSVSALRSQLLTNPPVAVPPVDDLVSLEEELKNLKNKTLARQKKAENDLKILDALHRKFKDNKEREKGKLKDKVRIKREATGERFMYVPLGGKINHHLCHRYTRSSCSFGTLFNTALSSPEWLWCQGFAWYENRDIEESSNQDSVWDKEVLPSGFSLRIHQNQEGKGTGGTDRERKEEVGSLIIIIYNFSDNLQGDEEEETKARE